MSARSAGDVLRETLAALGISQAELARQTGLTTKHINRVVAGVAPVSVPVAMAIGDATGIPAEVWLTLDAVHQVRKLGGAR